MITIHYHKDLYAADAVEGSVAVFREYADIDVLSTETHFQVQVVPHDPESGDMLVSEMSNHILGHSIELQGTTASEGGLV